MEENLQVIFGDSLTAAQRREIRKLCVANISKTMLELIKLHWMSAEDVQRECHVVGREHLDAALALGKGVILVTAHFGNWEYGGALLSVLGYPMNVIARDATDPFTRDLINNARGSKGVRIFGRWDARVLLRALRNNEIVAILPDQHAAEAAVTVEFMGRPADTATGPAIFALRSGAAILPGFASREPNDHIRLELLPALALGRTDDYEADVRAATQLINDVLGDAIRAHPEQWLWLHNRWKEPRFDG
jgi:KDO2-lipid IV(A) lauroyltransferase